MASNSCRHKDEVAIVGMGCRFPLGVDSPESFWNLVAEGRNVIRDLPEHRCTWQRTAYKGGFLDCVDQFDAPFFGVSAQEARYMDPQQRLLLEVAWEAIENAGINPDHLAGRRAGVFVGSFTNDYELLQARHGISSIGPYFGTGTSAALLAGRLAYRLGLTGPAMVVNTACSSSLVALHLARRSILSGESEFALVAGVNLILSDEISASFQAAGMLSPDAQCKPWDISANGYVRSEGCAVILLERVHDAKDRGARIWAHVAGSAVNQDGASSGLTAPSSVAQQRLIEDALKDACVLPDSVQYIEAHGTGTPVGDPIECEALARVFAPNDINVGRRQPLLLGSIKGNLGHTEAAAGLAGVIKTVLSMWHAQVPATINHHTLNPELQLGRIPTVIPTAPMPWPVPDNGICIAGVNSFGFGGTNAHVIIAHHEQDVRPELSNVPPPYLLCLSGPSQEVLGQIARRYESFLQGNVSGALNAVCHTVYVGRKHFKHRLAVQGVSAIEIAAALKGYCQRSNDSLYYTDSIRGESPRVAFLFTGQGAQYWGMGRELFETDETFRLSMLKCDEQLAPKLGRSLVELLIGADDSTEELAQTKFAQPALFALQVSLVKMFQAWGISPVAVLGHSVGEFAAAVTAGVMSISDGLALVEARGRLMQELPGGRMTAVQAGVDEVESLLACFPRRLVFAAVNTPNSCVIAGDEEAITEAHERLLVQGIAFAELDVSHAFHSPMMQAMVQPFATLLRQVQLNTPSIPFFSTVTGKLASEELTEVEYWCEQVIRPVQYESAVRQLDSFQFDACLEIGPAPVLVNLAQRCGVGGQTIWLGAQQNNRSGRGAAIDVAARLHTLGVHLNFARIYGAAAHPMISLPTYPFQRKSFWIEPPKGHEAKSQVMDATMIRDVRKAVDEALVQTDSKEVFKDYYTGLPERAQVSSNSVGVRPPVRFVPFDTPVPGFSWLSMFLGHSLTDDMQAMVDQANGDMRSVLFDGIEFHNVSRVLDIGGGDATDLIELAQNHGHLVLDGCNISGDQIASDRHSISKVGLEERIHLYDLDSAKSDFPGLYDLVISRQAIHTVQDKENVLRNILEHLRKGAFFVTAEIVSNQETSIDYGPLSAHFDTKQNWAGLFSRHQLRLVRCVDVSREIANYLHDEDFERTLGNLAGDADALTIARFHALHSLGQLLHKGRANYLLLLIQRDYLSTQTSLLEENMGRLERPTPYTKARRFSAAQSVKTVLPTKGLIEPITASALPALMPNISPASKPRTNSTNTPADSICKMVGDLLECSPEFVDAEQALVAQGLNSILAINLSMRLKMAFGLSVSVKALLNGATVSSLARNVPNTVTDNALPSAVQPVALSRTAPPSKPDYSNVLDNISSMSEAEINRLLAQLEAREETS